MQLTLNFVILATALTSVVAVPLRSREVDISAREIKKKSLELGGVQYQEKTAAAISNLPDALLTIG